MYSVVPFLYFLRVPLLVGIALALFAPISLLNAPLGFDNSGLRAMLGGLFDVETVGVGFATAGALIACGICWFLSSLVLEHGHARFGIIDPHGPNNKWTILFRFRVIHDWKRAFALIPQVVPLLWDKRYQHNRRIRLRWQVGRKFAHLTHPIKYRPAIVTVQIGVLYTAAALSLIAGIVAKSRGTLLESLIACVAGVLAFLFLVVVVVLIREDRIFGSVLSLRKMINAIPVLQGFASSIVLVVWVLSRVLNPFTGNLLPRLLEWTKEGYIDTTRPDRPMLPGHASAAAVTLIALLVYVILGAFRGARMLGILDAETGPPVNLPTILYVFLLASLGCLAFTGAAFFFDRFHIPVLLPWFVVTALFAQWPQSDHFFQIRWIASPPAPMRPADILAGRTGDSIVVVCAAGGGIQAAAWTAKVVSELDRSHGISKQIAAISAVSGGSVGAMHVLNAYQGGSLPQGSHDAIFANASASSLEQVSWGLTYPDLWKLVAPFLAPVQYGRGWALERAWDRDRSLEGKYLSDWRSDLAAGQRPAILFNATVVETGEILLFTNFEMDPTVSGARNAHQLYGSDGAVPDVPVLTAARLSASFSFVTPAARPSDVPRSRSYHVVDGGYYDNYGVAAMVGFLDQALGANTHIRRVLVIQIRCSPRGKAPKAGGGRGLLFQSTVPLTTLMSVRDAAQTARNDLELRLLQKSRQGSVDIRTVSFDYPDSGAPLSWHLSPDEVRSVERNWDRGFGQGSCQQRAVESFLARREPTDANASGCE